VPRREEMQVSTGAPGFTLSHGSASADGSAPALLAVRDLQVGYAGVQALHGVTLAVPEGRIVAILGNNGAGKTTLLRAISGTLPMHRGTVEGGSIAFAGAALPAGPADIVRAGVVQVPEGRRVLADLTVEENLRAGGLSSRGRGRRADARARVYELFPRLAERRIQRAGLLSGGEQQMLSLGRALATQPKALLADEVSLGLAPIIVDRLFSAIRQASADSRMGVLLVEQQPRRALAVADRWYLLQNGQLAGDGPASDTTLLDESYLPSASASSPARTNTSERESP
jgi:branched-chain amino acid transport system ATP-binding protein